MSDRMTAVSPEWANVLAVQIGDVLDGHSYADSVAALAIATSHLASLTSGDKAEALQRIDEWRDSCRRVIEGSDPLPWWPTHPGDKPT